MLKANQPKGWDAKLQGLNAFGRTAASYHL